MNLGIGIFFKKKRQVQLLFTFWLKRNALGKQDSNVRGLRKMIVGKMRPHLEIMFKELRVTTPSLYDHCKMKNDSYFLYENT